MGWGCCLACLVTCRRMSSHTVEGNGGSACVTRGRCRRQLWRPVVAAGAAGMPRWRPGRGHVCVVDTVDEPGVLCRGEGVARRRKLQANGVRHEVGVAVSQHSV